MAGTAAGDDADFAGDRRRRIFQHPRIVGGGVIVWVGQPIALNGVFHYVIGIVNDSVHRGLSVA